MARRRIRAQVATGYATGFGSNPGAIITDLSQRKMLSDTRSRQAMQKAYGKKRRRKRIG